MKLSIQWAAASLAATLAVAETTSAPSRTFPPWDGTESVADYAGRAGIPAAAATLNLGEIFTDRGPEPVTLALALIPAGRFTMGSPETEKDRAKDEGSQREVTISRPFYMGVYEVTRGQYERVMGRDPKSPVGEADRNAAKDSLSWGEAQRFCEKVSAATGWTLSLPTEAQWEYACRAGTVTRFSFGDDLTLSQIGDYAPAGKTAGGIPNLVGLKKPNPWGLYDMHGNLQEWCRDFYATNTYASGSATDPSGPAAGEARVLRAGKRGRSAARASRDPIHHYPGVGFRVVAELSPAPPAPPPAAALRRAQPIDGHLHGVAVYEGGGLDGVDETVFATLERQTGLRFHRFPYGQPEHGTDLQWWAKTFLRDIDAGRQRELQRLLDGQPDFVLLMTVGRKGRPEWIDRATASYARSGGRVIEESALANLPPANANSAAQDSTHVWAQAWESALRNACQPPWPVARVAAPAGAQAGETIAVQAAFSAAVGAKLTLTLEDSAGTACQSVDLPAPTALKTEASLAPSADLMAGAYHLAVRDAATAREYGCAYVTVTQAVTLALAGDDLRAGQGGTATVTATVTAAPGAGAGPLTLQWVVRDYRRGAIAFREDPLALEPGQAVEKSYQVPLQDPDTRAWVYWVQATLARNGKPLATAEERVYRWRPFTMREDLVFGTWHVDSDTRPAAARPLLAEYLRAVGIRSALEEGNEIFQRAGLRASTEHRRMTAVSFQKPDVTNRVAAWVTEGRQWWGKRLDSPSFAMWSLGEETGYGGNWSEAYPWRGREEAPEDATHWFREYLKLRYATLDALNRSWGREFKDWAEVKYLRKYAYPYGWLFVAPAKDVERNLAPYVDTHAFAEWWVHELVTSTVAGLREVNPVPVWSKSYEFTFVDWCEAPMTHFIAACDPHGTALWNAYVRRQTPGAPPCYHLNWGFFDDPPQMLQFWQLGVLSGATYIDNWGPTLNGDLTYTAAGARLRDLSAQLAPAANLLLQARLAEDTRVGIFLEETPWKLVHGRPGYFLKARAPGAATYGPTIQSPPGASWLASAEGPLYSALCDAGYSPCFLKRDEIPQAKIIFLPYTEALAQASADRLKAFVEAGGILVALPRLAEYDEGGHPYATLPGAGLNALFGVQLEDAWVGRQSIVPVPGRDDAARVFVENWKPGTPLPPEQEAGLLSFDSPSSYGGQPVRLVSEAHQAVRSVAADTKVLSRHEDDVPAITYRAAGKGAAIFLNLYRGWPPTLHVPTTEADVALARVLAGLAQHAGVEPDAWFEALDSNGPFAAQLAHFRYTGPQGIVRLLAVYNDWRSGDAETRFVVNTNLPLAAVYDVLSGERLPLRPHLGRPSTYVAVPRGTGRMLALLPYEVTAVTVAAARSRVQAGEPVELTASVAASAGPVDTHPGELTVFGPDGAPVRDAARHVLLDGKPIRVPTYLDLPPGDYRFAVQDGATRKSASCTVQVAANPAAKLPAAAPFGWPSWARTRIDVGPAEFERLLKDLAALYASEDPDADIAYGFYMPNRDRGRHRIGELLAHADWGQHAAVLRQMLARGERIVLVGEDLGLDPAGGAPSVPLTRPTQLAALAQLAGEGKLLAVRGLPDVLVLQLGRGALVLDRSSPDREAGAGPTRMNAWMNAWRVRMQAAGLLPGGEIDASRLVATAPGLDLRDWLVR